VYILKNVGCVAIHGQVRVGALWISLDHQLDNEEQGKTLS
jgi:hypothetical protein